MSRLIHYGLVVFVIIGILFQRQDLMMNTLLDTPFQVFDLVKTLVLSACLWNGLLNIIQSAGIIDRLSFVIRPVLTFIYGKTIEDKNIYRDLSANLLANLLGLGTLATISGLKAIRNLNTDYPHDSPSQAVKMLVVINTAGFSLLPTTMMTLRRNYHSHDILAFYPYSLVIGLTITLIGILIIRLCCHE